MRMPEVGEVIVYGDKRLLVVEMTSSLGYTNNVYKVVDLTKIVELSAHGIANSRCNVVPLSAILAKTDQ